MAKNLQKTVTLYPKLEDELASPINTRPLELDPRIPDRVIVTENNSEAQLTHSEVTNTELLSLLGIEGNIQIRLVALETIINATVAFMVPGFCQPWTGSGLAVSVETTVFTYAVPAGKVFFVDKVSLIGRADCISKYKVDAVTKDFLQIEWTKRSDQRIYPFGDRIEAGSTVTITVENLGEASADYFGNVHGRLVDL